MRRSLLALLFFVGLVAIWTAMVRAKIWSPVLLPSPHNVMDYLVSAARDGSLDSATVVTLRRLLIGYFIGLHQPPLRIGASQHRTRLFRGLAERLH